MNTPRSYSLFEKVDGKWVRLSKMSYRLDVARRAFQTALLNGCLTGHHMALRPVEIVYVPGSN
jgi:hypothetical protein